MLAKMTVFSVAILLVALCWFAIRVAITVAIVLLDIFLSVLQYIALILDLPCASRGNSVDHGL